MDAITDFLSLKYTASKNPSSSRSDQMSQLENLDTDVTEYYSNKKVIGSLKEDLHNLGDVNVSYCNETNYLDRNSQPDANQKLSESSRTPTTQTLVYETDIIFQNWVEDVCQKESETDKYLEVLKKEHGLINHNLTDSSKLVSTLSWTDEDKLPNISDIDLDRLFMEGNDKFPSSESINDISKGPAKPVNSAVNKKNPKQSFKNTKPKQKLLPKANKVLQDFDKTPCDKDIDSWMSESIRKENITQRCSRNRSNYLDILTNLEEIEIQTAPKVSDFKLDLCQRAEDGKVSRSESIDDIVSILEVLENENKRSRKYKQIFVVTVNRFRYF